MNSVKQPLILLCILVGFPQLSETIYTPSLPWLEGFFQTTANHMQLTLSIYFLGFALGVACFGYACDQFGRKPALLTGLAIYALSTLALGLVSQIESFLFFRFFQAFGASVGSVVIQTLLRDTYTGQARYQVFAQISLVMAIAPGLGPILGSLIATYISVHAIFWLLATLGVALWIASNQFLNETVYTKSEISMTTLGKRMFLDSHILRCAWIIAVLNSLLFGFLAEIPFIWFEKLQLPAQAYGAIGVLLSSVIFLGGILNKHLLKTHKPWRLHQLGTYMMAFGSLCLFSLVLENLVLLALSMGIILLGICLSLSNILSMALKDYQHCLGRAGALFGLIYYILLSACMGVLSYLHNGTLWVLPLYFFMLCCSLILLPIQNRE